MPQFPVPFLYVFDQLVEFLGFLKLLTFNQKLLAPVELLHIGLEVVAKLCAQMFVRMLGLFHDPKLIYGDARMRRIELGIGFLVKRVRAIDKRTSTLTGSLFIGWRLE